MGLLRLSTAATVEHDWPDDAEDPSAFDVQHMQPYQATKTYRCPGCNHEIRAGEGHKVVVPRADPSERRHWHTGCWHREEKRRA